MENEERLLVGNKVWIVDSLSRPEDGLKEAIISKIGRKYFEVTPSYMGRFHINSLIHDRGNYSPRFKLYLSKEDYEDEIECSKIHSELRNIFGYGKSKIGLIKLRQILSIINS